MFKKYLLLGILALNSMIVCSKVKLPHIFNDNMVLKQKSKVNVWGTSSAQTKVRITTSWDKKVYTVMPAADGKWRVSLSTPTAGGPYEISFNDGEETVLKNIMVGEVWLCSGQSNMSMTMKGGKNQPILNSEDIIAKSANNDIRLFTVKNEFSGKVKEDLNGQWYVSSPEYTANTSAVAFQFAQMLQKHLKVPVGIIVTSWGGTPIRSWMGDSFNEFAQMYPEQNDKLGSKSPKVLYNAMIAPLIPYTLSGFLWYQGEADRKTPELYEKMLPAMVKEWRSKWGQRDLGFYYAQIAPWLYTPDNGGSHSPYLREAQLNALKHMGKAGMAVTADIGSDKTIHPPDKTTVAERLFKSVIATTYGDKNTIYKGPEYKSMKIQGQKIVLDFRNAESGLMMKNDKTGNFEIAGADKVFHKAKASIIGNRIEVESGEVKEPLAVRYAFKDYFIGNLYNKEGLPAVPFRTDTWSRE